MAKVAVCLSGCGVFDGSEIHEAVLTLLALDRAGAKYVCCAPNMDQAVVVNHLTHKRPWANVATPWWKRPASPGAKSRTSPASTHGTSMPSSSREGSGRPGTCARFAVDAWLRRSSRGRASGGRDDRCRQTGGGHLHRPGHARTRSGKRGLAPR